MFQTKQNIMAFYILYEGKKQILLTQDYKEYCNYSNTDWDEDDEDREDNQPRNSRITIPDKKEQGTILRVMSMTPIALKFMVSSMNEGTVTNFDEFERKMKGMGVNIYSDDPEYSALYNFLKNGAKLAFEYFTNGLMGVAIGDISVFVEPAIEKAIKNGRCTYGVTGKTHIYQDFYNCNTCFTDISVSICRSCAYNCHAGHNLTFHRGRETPNLMAYCDCGASDTWTEKCKCI